MASSKWAGTLIREYNKVNGLQADNFRGKVHTLFQGDECHRYVPSADMRVPGYRYKVHWHHKDREGATYLSEYRVYVYMDGHTDVSYDGNYGEVL